jgi:hypothetical protein
MKNIEKNYFCLLLAIKYNRIKNNFSFFLHNLRITYTRLIYNEN